MGEAQQWLTDVLASLGASIPFGYAFAVGMVSTVNPCGFAMLPAYLGLYLGTGERSEEGFRQAAKAILVTLFMTAGFVALFASVGLVISAGGRFFIDLTPWIALGLGAVLAALGVAMLFERSVLADIGARIAPRVGKSGSKSAWGFFVFGVAYALASLSCTLPLFLVVVGGSLAVETLFASAVQFVLYGLGMGSVILVVTLGVGVFKGAMVEHLNRVTPYVDRASAVLLVLAGSYIVYYWLFKGGLVHQLI